MSLLVVGSIALDTIRTPEDKEYKDVLGGSCSYFSYAASYLTDVRLVGVVGSDFPQKYITLLEGRRIDTKGLEVVHGGQTFRWAGTYAEDMNDRTTDDLQFGVLGEFDPKLPESYRETEYVFLACAQPQLQMKVLDQMAKKPFVVFDTIEFYIETEREALLEVFKRCDGVIVNDSEVKLLTGERNLVHGGERLLGMGPRFAVVKKGEHGGLLFTQDGIWPFPAYPLKTVLDPTGAGDSFAAGFMGYLAANGKTNTDNLRQAVVHGAAIASFACEGVSLDRLRQLEDAELTERVLELVHMMRVPG